MLEFVWDILRKNLPFLGALGLGDPCHMILGEPPQGRRKVRASLECLQETIAQDGGRGVVP